MESVEGVDVHEFGDGSEEAEDGEGSEHNVPDDEGLPELEGRSVLHPVLEEEDEADVDDGGIDAQHPVPFHPSPTLGEVNVFPVIGPEVGDLVLDHNVNNCRVIHGFGGSVETKDGKV